jgi:hypothetical protein
VVLLKEPHTKSSDYLKGIIEDLTRNINGEITGQLFIREGRGR